MKHTLAIAVLLAAGLTLHCNGPSDEGTGAAAQSDAPKRASSTTPASAKPDTGPGVPQALLGTWKAEVSNEWLKQFRKAYSARMSEAEVDAAVAKIKERSGRTFTIEANRMIAQSPGGESKSQPFRVEAATDTKATLVLDDPDRPNEPIRLHLVSKDPDRASIVYGIEDMPELVLRRQ